MQKLGIHALKDTLLYVPPAVVTNPDVPLPLIISLHGAGGTPDNGLSYLKGVAERYNAALLAPGSRGSTWDVLRGGLGTLLLV